jgi:hypothetical protein
VKAEKKQLLFLAQYCRSIADRLVERDYRENRRNENSSLAADRELY